MSYEWRVAIPSGQGLYERNLSSTYPDSHIENLVGKTNKTTFKVLVAGWSALLGDSPVVMKSNKIIHKFLTELVDDPFNFTTALANLAHQLEKSLSYDELGRVIIDPLFDEFKNTPVFREYHEFYKHRDPRVLTYLLTFLNFGKKVVYKNPNLESNAFRAWTLKEEDLSKLVLPAWVSNVRAIMALIFEDWSEPAFFPKHGGGAVSEMKVIGTEAKNRRIRFSDDIIKLYIVNDTEGSVPEYPTPTGLMPTKSYNSQHSRLKFVPKTFDKVRSMCMEPVVYQWAQQALRLELEHYLTQSCLANHVILRDQKHNQIGAQIGSARSLCDTIDLSAASDSVAWILVQSIFPEELIKHLNATRTRTVLTWGKRKVSLHKYAPMGSALCFPVQCVVYSAIVAMVGIAESYCLDWRNPGCFDLIDLKRAWGFTHGKSLHKVGPLGLYPFKVYGDDIICDNTITSNVVDALSQLGFEVNTDKSFVGNKAMRESCGKRYFAGHDVSPFTFKLKSLDEELEIDAVASLIDVANRAGEWQYSTVRRHVVAFILHNPIKGVSTRALHKGKNPIKFSSNVDEALTIFHPEPRNYHLKERCFVPGMELRQDTRYYFQRDEFHHLGVGPLKVRKWSKKFDNFHYIEWMRSRYHLDGEVATCDQPPGMKADTLVTGVRWVWTPN